MKVKKIISFIIYRPLPELIMLNYRLISFFDESSFLLSRNVASYFRYRLLRKYGVEICKGALLSKSLILRHPVGIVIGGGAVIKERVTIHQGVTLGAKDFNENGNSVFCKQIINDDVIIGAGAKILGNVEIGKNSVVSANAVVTKNVPENSIVVGVNKIKSR
ncbi:serine O-acetyltransferase [Shewanella indica]|uniref:serine O-acetyltransferase n=1 Tax=Shewanella indica TaxID=768528 RepID=UPI000C3207FA|nr:serine acetyltransferase [Shewanella indica]GHB22044.1 hypothetical protein GCM10007107_38210 [Shewanella indica]